MTNPFVSITTITYNQVNYVHQTLTSAIEQDYDNLEVIVSDDGSQDGTAEIIRDYAFRYPDRLKAILDGPHLGIVRNANRALKACQGKYIAIQGGDDILLPGKIKAQAEWMEADESRVLCGHDVDIFDSITGRSIKKWSQITPLRSGKGAEAILKYGVPYAATSLMLRASALPAGGFDERLNWSGDVMLKIDCLAGGGAFGYVEGVYARYRVSESQISKQRNLTAVDSLLTLAIVEGKYPHLAKHCNLPRAKILYDLGIYWMKRKNYCAARDYFLAAMKASVFSWKLPIVLFLTYLPVGWSISLLRDQSSPRKFTDFLSDMFLRK